MLRICFIFQFVIIFLNITILSLLLAESSHCYTGVDNIQISAGVESRVCLHIVSEYTHHDNKVRSANILILHLLAEES